MTIFEDVRIIYTRSSVTQPAKEEAHHVTKDTRRKHNINKNKDSPHLLTNKK